jgi:hypothetical protein
MALLDGDWSIAANGNIRSEANATTHEVLELHRWLMDKLDDSTSSGDDLLDVTNIIIPSTRSTDNIITLNSPYNIDDTAAERFYNGSISQNGGDDLYSGLQVVGSVAGTTTLMLVQNGTVLTNHWGDTDTGKGVDSGNNILSQIIVKTRSGGTDIDGKRLRVQARELGNTYAEFSLTLGQGVGVAAIFTNSDDFNQTASGTIAGWTGISNTEGYQGLDVNADSTDEYYYSQWDRDTRSVNDLYERAKYLTRRGEATTLYGIEGQQFRGITHSIIYDTQDASEFFTEGELVTFGNGATARILADTEAGVDAGVTGTMHVQLITGTAPANNDTIAGATCNALVNGTPTARTINGNCFLGNYTGSLTGAYGVGVQPTDLSQNDSLRSFADTALSPPNYVNVEVTGLQAGDVVFSAKTKTHSTTASGAHSLGDTTLNVASGIPVDYDTIGRIIVDGTEHVFTTYSGTTVTIAAPGLAGALTGGETVSVTQFNNDEFTADTAAGVYNDSGDTVIQFTTTVGLGFPSAGKVRIWNTANAWYEQYSYTGVSGQQLTGVSPALSRDISGEVGFIPYIDEASSGASVSKTVVHSTDVSGRHRVYNASANIVPFEVGFTIGSAGSSSPAIRGADA